MDINKIVEYWTKSAQDDLPVTAHLLASKDYHYALFFGHLYLEKLMKALVAQVREEHAPRSHNLIYLAECADLSLSGSQREILASSLSENPKKSGFWLVGRWRLHERWNHLTVKSRTFPTAC